MSTELFRFLCARPARKDTRSIKVHASFHRNPSTFRSLAAATTDTDSSGGSIDITALNLTFTEQIRVLDVLLGPPPPELEVGINTELSSELVRESIAKAFPDEDLDKLVGKDDWKRDENMLDYYLIGLWQNASDPWAIGPQITRHRQLHDLVHQAVDLSVGKDGKEPFVLKGLEFQTPLLVAASQANRSEAPSSSRNLTESSLKTLSAEVTDTEPKKIASLNEALKVLNSAAVLEFWDRKVQDQSMFQLTSGWFNLLSQKAQTIARQAGIASADPPQSLGITVYYERIIRAINSIVAGAESTTSFKSGLYSVGPFNLELNNPWNIPTADSADADVSGDVLPPENPSKIKPAGVGDLLIVRDHVWQYVGGEIGAIQNVLKSEKLVRETKRLDRTETVVFSSTTTEDEQERDQQTTSRFALNKEASSIIKSDSALKIGVTTTAYGPSVTVKGDFSYATNNSQEASNSVEYRVASQYSQDITSRAASKVIEKTFNSTSQTTISEFHENYGHEFNNVGDNKTNISGVYQWVNKVSQCQMYNYGKRLLIDITLPEPAAFLMTQSNEKGPVLEKPIELVETATDLNESNCSEIAARYETSGIKPPGSLLFNFSRSFKAEGGGGTAQSSAINMDVEIPAGYLAYSATIQVGVRTGFTATTVGDYGWFGIKTGSHTEYGPPRDPNTYVSVAGQLVKAGIAKETNGGGLLGGPVEKATTENTASTLTFDLPLLSNHVSVSVAQENYLSMSGTIKVCCIRQPWARTSWQQTTYDSILTAYTKQKMDYERSLSETAISEMNVVTGNNPLENVTVVSNELKKACISFITAQNFGKFGSVELNPEDKIPDVTDYDKAIKQGHYADFFEKAFEWENMTYTLYPYFWGRRSGWRERLGFHSPDPSFSDFVKAGAARVTIPARLGFSLEVIHLLDTGKPWQEGPVSTLVKSPYYSVAQEILKAEKEPKEIKVSRPWYTVVPTDLVRLREGSELPRFKMDEDDVWVEKKVGEE